MTTRNRMARMWVPFTTGDEVLTLAAGGSSRTLLPSLWEAKVGRTLDEYTVTRVILSMYLHRTTTGESVATIGLIILNENLALANLNPADDPNADWFYHEETVFTGATTNSQLDMKRDVSGQRRAKAQAKEMYLYIEHRSAAGTLSFHVSGRALVLQR